MNKDKIYIIPDLNNIDDYILLAKNNGFHFEYNDFYTPSEIDDKALILRRIQRYNSLQDMPGDNSLHGAFLDISINSADKYIREHSEKRMIESMDIAQKLNVTKVIFHTNYISNYKDQTYLNLWLESNVRFINILLERYTNISIYMENMFDLNPNMLSLISNKIKHERFGICLDYAHAHVFGKVDIKDWFDALGSNIKHMHINDNDLVNDSHLAVGDGLINYDIFKKYYKEYCPDSTVLFEMNGIQNIQKTLDYFF